MKSGVSDFGSIDEDIELFFTLSRSVIAELWWNQKFGLKQQIDRNCSDKRYSAPNNSHVEENVKQIVEFD